jgi:hypothetical protein
MTEQLTPIFEENNDILVTIVYYIYEYKEFVILLIGLLIFIGFKGNYRMIIDFFQENSNLILKFICFTNFYKITHFYILNL